MTALLIIKIVGLIVGAVASAVAARQDAKASGKKRNAVILIVVGFSVAVAAELVDASQKQKNALDATRRNNELLAEVQRTLHPLYPLGVNLRWRAVLTNAPAFRTQLEQIYKRQNPGSADVVYLYSSDSEFPSCGKDPIGFAIVSAALASTVQLYSRQRTKAGRFEEADVKFSPSVKRDFPETRGFGKGTVAAGGDLQRHRIESRDYLFSRANGLLMSDGYQKIDFVDGKNTTDVVSVDDLPGATLEVATESIDPSDDPCQSTAPAGSESITFAGIAIILPGWRQLVIDPQMFTSIGPTKDWPDWSRYRFTFPEQKSEFEKLIKDERLEVVAGRP